jgi:hypothetical protein
MDHHDAQIVAAAMAAGMQAGSERNRKSDRRRGCGCGCLPWWLLPILLMLPCDLIMILIWLQNSAR